MNTETNFYFEEIPVEIRESFKLICEDMLYLFSKWDLYQELFNPKNTALLADVAKLSFYLIEESLRNDITLAIVRLNDSSKTHGQENYSLANLVRKCEKSPELNALLEDFNRANHPIRDIRTHHLEHREFKTAFRPKQATHLNFNKSEIDIIFEHASKVINFIYQKYVAKLGILDLRLKGEDTAETIMMYLDAGKEYIHNPNQ